MDADILSLLLRANIAGAAAVLLVLALRAPVRRTMGAGAAYGLWLAPPLAMAASVLPGGPTWDMTFPVPIPDGAPGPGDVPVPATAPAPPVFLWLLIVWGAGVIGAMLVMAIRQHQFMIALGKPELDPEGLPIMRARDGFAVGPAVIGTLSPRIVLPADFETRYSAEERRVVLAHERVHLFGHDAQANAIAAALQCLCWFNPLAHVAMYFFRMDQELSADAAVVRQFPGREHAYAEALLKTQIASRQLILGCQWPARSEHPLKQRISLLRLDAPLGRMGGVAVAAIAVCAGLIAWAGSPRGAFAPETDSVAIWTVLKPERDQPRAPRRMVVAQGAWGDVVYDMPDGRSYRVSLNPRRLADAVVEVKVRVESGGVVSEPAALMLHSAEPGFVRLGREALLVTVGERAR